MARAPVIAVDFLGLSKMPHDSNNQTSAEDHRGRFLEPTLSMPTFQATGFWPAQANVPGNLGNFSTTHERNVQMAGGQNVAPKSKDVPCASGRCEEGRTDGGSSRPSASVEKTRLDKPLEELSEEDIMQLTREDCRRYLKEKGMRRPSWNKSQAIQQVLSLKGLFDNKCDEERKVTRINGQKTSTAESSANRDPSKLKQVVRSPGHQTTQMQQASAFQRLQEFTYEQDAVPNRLQQVSPLIGQQASPYSLQQSSLHRQQSLHSYNITRERVKEPSTTSLRVLDGHGGNDLQQSRQFNQSTHAPLNYLVGADANESALVGSHLTDPGSTVPSFPGFSKGLPAYVCPSDTALSMAIQQRVGNRVPFQTTCSQYVQSVGAGTSATGKPPSAQLTVFYSGTVNVYDDVSADKALAIMLLAASGDTSKPSSLTKASVDATISAPTNISGILATPYNKHPALVPASLPGPTPPVTFTSPSVSIQQPSRATQPEHPPSRKASLQRFLEKRKDRGRIRSPYLTSRKMAGDVSTQLTSLHDRPGLAAHALRRSAPGQKQTESSGSETSSPTRPPRTPLQTSSNEHGTSPGRRPSEVQGFGVDEEKRPSSETEISSPSQQNSGLGCINCQHPFQQGLARDSEKSCEG